MDRQGRNTSKRSLTHDSFPFPRKTRITGTNGRGRPIPGQFRQNRPWRFWLSFTYSPYPTRWTVTTSVYPETVRFLRAYRYTNCGETSPVSPSWPVHANISTRSTENRHERETVGRYKRRRGTVPTLRTFLWIPSRFSLKSFRGTSWAWPIYLLCSFLLLYRSFAEIRTFIVRISSSFLRVSRVRSLPSYREIDL